MRIAELRAFNKEKKMVKKGVIALLSTIAFLCGQHFLPKKHEMKNSPFGKGD